MFYVMQNLDWMWKMD